MSNDAVRQESIPIIHSSRFEIGEVIGRGSWGIVYEALDTRTGRKGAIKVLSPSGVAKRQQIERGWSDSSVIGREVSDNGGAYAHIVPREIFTDDLGREFIWMPIRAKGTLEDELAAIDSKDEDVMRKELEEASTQPQVPRRDLLSFLTGPSPPLTPKEIQKLNDSAVRSKSARERFYTLRTGKLMLDIASGLFDTHTGLKRVHRDLKPSNIFIEYSGKALIGDFSSSTVVEGGKTREAVGEAYVKAFEVARKVSPGDVSSDIYSLGSIFGRMLIGEYLNQDRIDNALDANKAIADIAESEAKARLKEYVKKAPRVFRKILKRSLAYNPSDRYHSASDFRDALTKAFDYYHEGRIGVSKRYGAVSTIALLLGALALGRVTLDNVVEKNKSLESKVESSEQDIEFERKYRVIEKYLGKETKEDDMWDVSKLRVYQEMFNDHKTAVAAYLYPEETAKAISACGGKTDFESLRQYWVKFAGSHDRDFRNYGIFLRIDDATDLTRDNWMMYDQKSKDKVHDEFRDLLKKEGFSGLLTTPARDKND